MKILFLVSFALVTFGCTSITGGKLLDGEGGDPAKLVVFNKGQREITGMLISRCDRYMTGFNRLGSGQFISPGGQHEFDLSPGCWDFQIGGDGYQSSARINLNPGQRLVVNYE